MAKPKISFVIPTWNGGSYIAETIESIRNQTLKEIEIIVVDDASPDATWKLMVWYQKQDDRIKYHRLESNGGVEEARNIGNKLAEADLICVSDHDDLCLPHRALYSYHFMNHYKDIKCLTSSYWELNVDGQPVKQFYPQHMSRDLFESGNFVWFHSSACYWKSDIIEHPYRKGDGKTDDWNFLEDWTKAGMTFYSSNRVLANCRRLPWSQMQFRRASQGLEPSYIL